MASIAFAQEGVSLVVPNETFASDPRLIEMLMLSAFAAAVALLMAGLLIRLAEMVIEQRGRLGNLIQHAQLRAKIGGRFVDRRKKLITGLAAVSVEVKLMSKRRHELARKYKELVKVDDEIVHMVGDETEAATCFFALINNRYVETAVLAEQEHGFLHSSWAKAQMIEIWADNMGAARAALDRAFPAIFGFSVVRLTPAVMRDSGSGGRPGESTRAQ